MFKEAEMLRWPDFPACCGENFDSGVLKKIKEKPGVWLSTLPMYEYAFLALTAAMRKYGGELTPYIDDLFNQRMCPILLKYLSALTKYRVHRHLKLMKFDYCVKEMRKKPLVQEAREMNALAAATRAAIRNAVEDFIEEERFRFKRVKCPCKCGKVTSEEP